MGYCIEVSTALYTVSHTTQVDELESLFGLRIIFFLPEIERIYD